MTEIFEETLDPPTIAAKGLFGTSTAPEYKESNNNVREMRKAKIRWIFGKRVVLRRREVVEVG